LKSFIYHHHRQRRCSDIHNNTQARVAIGFFGVSRNLSSTIGSIERHVFDVLDRNNISYDVFWNTMSVSTVRSTRTMENENGDVDTFDVQLIRPCRVSLIDQDSIQHTEFKLFLHSRMINVTTKMLPHNKFRYDIWSDNYGSVKNLLCAFYTQQG